MDEIKELLKYEFELYAWNEFLGSKKDKFGLKRDDVRIFRLGNPASTILFTNVLSLIKLKSGNGFKKREKISSECLSDRMIFPSPYPFDEFDLNRNVNN